MESLTRKLTYFKDICHGLNSAKTVENENYLISDNGMRIFPTDIQELYKFENKLKHMYPELTINDLLDPPTFSDMINNEVAKEVLALTDATLNRPLEKLFSMARHNENKASIKRIELEFNVKLDKAGIRRKPQLIELIKKHNLLFSL
jgi:hypothetical protein